jgi:hypothetical protein
MSIFTSNARARRSLLVPDQAQPRLLEGRQLLPLACAAALAVSALSCGNRSEPQPTPPAPQTNTAPAAAAAVSPEVAKVVGKWERPDGGYVLEIRSVDPSGKADVAYFNPNPIHVSRAAVWRDKDTTKVAVELRDENYPGCTYTLEFNPQTDQLFGQYFQAAVQETYEVVFSRLK